MHPILIRACFQATAASLVAHWAGWPMGLAAAIGLMTVQALHCLAVRRTWRALDVQVRWFFLGLLLLGGLPGLWWIHAVQTLGLFALLVADYCPAARLLVLMPWNRPVPLTGRLVMRALLMAPQPGPIGARLWP